MFSPIHSSLWHKISAKQSNLFTSRNTSDSLWVLEGQGKPCFSVGAGATCAFLRICWVVIYRNVAMLLKPSWSWLERVFVGYLRHNSHALPSAQDTDTRLDDSGERQSCQYPGHTEKVTSLAGKHVKLPNGPRKMFSFWQNSNCCRIAYQNAGILLKFTPTRPIQCWIPHRDFGQRYQIPAPLDT